MASTFERIKNIIVEQLGVDEKDVIPSATFLDDLNVDSLDLVEFVMALEEEFSDAKTKIEIPDEDVEKIKTVQDAVDYVNNLLGT